MVTTLKAWQDQMRAALALKPGYTPAHPHLAQHIQLGAVLRPSPQHRQCRPPALFVGGPGWAKHAHIVDATYRTHSSAVCIQLGVCLHCAAAIRQLRK